MNIYIHMYIYTHIYDIYSSICILVFIQFSTVESPREPGVAGGSPPASPSWSDRWAGPCCLGCAHRGAWDWELP